MAVIPVKRAPLTLAERTYLPQIAAGLKTTLKHMFQPKLTMEYPEQRPAIPAGYRGVPTLVMDPHGREKCVSCQLCEFVCPPKAIRLQNQYSMTGYTREEMVNDKARLYELGGTLPDQHFKWDKKKAAEEHPPGH